MELSLLKNKLARGSVAGLVRVGLAVPLYLIMTPFVLHKLGTELFGLWSFGTLVISVMTLTDFGFKNALIFHIAHDLHDHDRVKNYFNVVFLSYLVMALAILLVVMLFGNVITAELLKVPQNLYSEAWFVLWITAASFGLRFLSISFQGLMEAYQEHAAVQIILLGWLFINFAGTLIALSLKPDIYALGVVTLCANAFVLAAFWTYVRRCCPFIQIAPAFVSREAFKSMLGYGSGVQVATLLIAGREPLLKVLIARTYDLASVATFELVYKLCTQLVSLVATPLLGSFSASALLSKDRASELGRVLRPMFGFCVAVFVPMILFVASFSQSLVVWWLGPDYSHVGTVLPLAFAAFAIYYTTETLYKAIEASGLSGYSAFVQTASLSAIAGAFFIFVDNADEAIPAALFAGFITFSLVNHLMFRQRFPSIHLCEFRQWVWLVGPALGYLVMQKMTPSYLMPLLFIFYFGVHLWCMRISRLFDLFGLARKIIAAVETKT